MAAVALLEVGCVSDEQRPHEFWERQLTEAAPSRVEEVSLIRLVASPREFKDHYVRVSGYLHMEFERDRLFLHETDCQEWLESNSVCLGLCSASSSGKLHSLSDHYVSVEGKVWCDPDSRTATLWNITRVERSGLPTIVPLSVDRTDDRQPSQSPRSTNLPATNTKPAGTGP